MRGQLGIGPVDLRVIQIRPVHPGLQVIGDQPGRYPAEELNAAAWHSVQARWSILITGRTNSRREQHSTIANTFTVCRRPVRGSTHRPICP